MQFVRSLSSLTAQDVLVAGGKGASLGEMLHAGIPVPGGFVVLSTTFDQFIEKTGLDVQIEAILDMVNHKTISSVESASERIQALILDVPMPIDIEQEIMEQFAHEKLERVAVRSSATAEDGAEHAWAGQLDSYLNTSKNNLIEKIRHCWASLFTPRAIFYRFEKELHKDHISVAVVVQKMVQSEISGIAFSVHPVTQDRNQMIIEAGFGLGEAIVSGSVTPDSYVVRKDNNKIDITVNHQQKALYKAPNGGNERVQLDEKGKEQILTQEQILELSEIIMRIENHYGFPCDIEWAYEGGTFYIVQSRPITTLQSEDNTLDELNIQTDLWSLKSTEGYMHLCYPFILGFELFPKVKPLKNHHTSFVAVENEMIYVYENFSILSSIRDEFLEKSFHDSLYYNQFKKMYYEYVIDFEKEIQTLNQKDITLLSDEELIDSYDSFFKIYLKQFAHVCAISEAITQTSSLYIDPHFKQVMGDGFDKDFHILTHPSTFSFLEEEKQARELLLQDYLEKQFIDEVKLNTHANEYFYIKSNYKYGHNLTAHDFKEMIIEQSNNSGNTEKQKMQLIEKDIIFQRYEFSLYDKFLLQIVDDFFKIVDDRKKNMMKASYYQIHFLKELEKRTGLQFRLLTYTLQPEYKDILRGQYDLGELQERAKGLFVINDNTLKPIFITGEKYKLTKQALDNSINRGLCGDGKSIIGIRASQGKVTGIVKVLLNYEDIGFVQKGNIIVSSMTRPEMMPAMEKAAAFVTDEGGITCHASIVAREMNKPCIIGTKIATQVLKDGDLVEVDADNGIVRILARAIDEIVSMPSDYYYRFELSMRTIVNYFHMGVSPTLKIDGEWLCGKAYFRYNFDKPSLAYIPKENLIRYGKKYLLMLQNNIGGFADEVYTQFTGIVTLADKLQVLHSNWIQNDIIPDLSEYFHEYKALFPRVIGVGYCLDMAMEEYVKERGINLDSIHHVGESFITKERRELAYIANIGDGSEQNILLEKHRIKWSFLLNNYYGYHEVGVEYFKNRFDDVRGIIFSQPEKITMPTNREEWISFSVYIRDERKKCNALFNGLYVDYLKRESKKLGLNFSDVVLLTPDEFELLKDKGIPSFENHERYLIATHHGFKDFSKEQRDGLILQNNTDIDKKILFGVIASKGKVTGRARIILEKDDFGKLHYGEIIIASMTRPDFGSILPKASAIVTNEGGVTCHAAIVSRELGVPCIISTGNATEVIQDGDLVEVDADNGIVRILESA